MPRRKITSVKDLKGTPKGNLRRKKIAEKICRARRWDREGMRPSFGRRHFSRYKKKKFISKIRYFFNKGVKVVRVLDLGAGSGKYWDKLVRENPELKGRIEVVCVQPTKVGFGESIIKRFVRGSFLTMREQKLKSLGKFHIVVSFSGEYTYSPEKKLLKKRIKEVLVESHLRNFLWRLWKGQR